MSSVVLIGKPNSGKSLLFNRLTGLKQKVANFPGATVQVKKGQLKTGVVIVDSPGVYTLNALTADEVIAVDHFNKSLNDPEVKGVVCILDITRLERSLVLALQVLEVAKKNKKNLVFAVNMMDSLKNGSLDIKKMEKTFGVKVLPISAKTRQGLGELEGEIHNLNNEYVDTIEYTFDSNNIDQEAKKLAAEFLNSNDTFLKNQNVLDNFFLSKFLGGPIFLFIMFLLFQAIFSWSVPLMDFIDESIVGLGSIVSGFFPEGAGRDFINDAVFAGFGSFLVFVPQIAVLTLIISVLEDSGYLARAAIITHRPLSFFGLSGKSFIPYLTGHACAIPAIFAARTIESRKRRLITLLTIPLMSCSARLPVYGLLVFIFIPESTILGGLFNLRGAVFFALYLFGLITALLVSIFLSKKVYKAESDTPFIIELPPYRLPGFKPVFMKAVGNSWKFIKGAGPIIFMVSFVIWLLGYFPQGNPIEETYLGSIGKVIGPIFEPLGLDWKYGIAILVSFLAREVFVGTLGTILGIEGADEDPTSLIERLQGSELTLGAGIGLLGFYVIALQCVATVGALKSELEDSKTPTILFFAYGALAYIVALILKVSVDSLFVS